MVLACCPNMGFSANVCFAKFARLDSLYLVVALICNHLRKVYIFSLFYNVSQPNFGFLLNIGFQVAVMDFRISYIFLKIWSKRGKDHNSRKYRN